MKSSIFSTLILILFFSCTHNDENKLYIFNKRIFLADCRVKSAVLILPDDFKLQKSVYSLDYYRLLYSTEVCEIEVEYNYNVSKDEFKDFIDNHHGKSFSINNVDEQIVGGKITEDRYLYVFENLVGYFKFDFVFKHNLSNELKDKLFRGYTKSIKLKNEKFVGNLYFDNISTFISKIKIEKDETIIGEDVDVSIYKLGDSINYLLVDSAKIEYKDCDQLFARYVEILWNYRYKFEDNDIITVVSNVPKDDELKQKDILFQLMLRKEHEFDNDIRQSFGGWFDCIYISKNFIKTTL